MRSLLEVYLWRVPYAVIPSNRCKPVMPKSFTPEASGSPLQKRLFNLPKPRLCRHLSERPVFVHLPKT